MSFFKKLLLMPLMCSIYQTWAIKRYTVLGRCCERLGEPLWCCNLLHLDEMLMKAASHTHPGIPPPMPSFQNTHTFVRYLCCNLRQSFLLLHTQTHTLFSPLKLLMCFCPLLSPPPQQNKNHLLFLLYLLLTAKAHFSQQLPSVRY